MPETTAMRITWPVAAALGLDVELRGALEQQKAPVIFVPGLGLPADWSFYPYMLQKLSERRPVLSLAEPASLSESMRHCEALAGALGRGELPPGAEWKPNAVGLLGHASGASLSLLVAAHQPAVCGIVGIATMCTFNRGGQEDERVSQDVAAHGDRLQVEVAARQVKCPIVLVHGEEDQVAPFDEGELVFHWLPKERSSIVLLEKTGHSLGANHPFDGTNKELDRTVRIVRDFFDREMG
jgi:pimeloyl-ACP methyl ester carboxylesterase